MVPRMSAPVRQTTRRRVGPTPVAAIENAKASVSVAVAQSTPAGRLEFCAMRIATGPASARVPTSFGAWPKTFVKSPSKSFVARGTGADSCALSTIETEALMATFCDCGRAAGFAASSKMPRAALGRNNLAETFLRGFGAFAGDMISPPADRNGWVRPMTGHSCMEAAQPAAHEINKSEARFAMFVCATNYTQNFASCLRNAGSARHSDD